MRIIFIDNGTTGTIGVYDGQYRYFGLTPVVSQLDYTKKTRHITRIDTVLLKRLLSVYCDGKDTLVILEHPMVNPNKWTSSYSAIRALEATLTVIETLGLPYQYCDSKEWQKGLLPSSGKKGTTAAMLKQESMDIGLRRFPQIADMIRKHKDADGILGAYAFWQKLH